MEIGTQSNIQHKKHYWNMQLPWKAFTLPGSKVKREIFN
jgi:hypothetical protein